MKTLIFGAGPLGSLYAHIPHGAGRDVTVPARGRRYEFIRDNGIVTVYALCLLFAAGCAFEDAGTDVSVDGSVRGRKRRAGIDSVTMYERSNAARHGGQIYIEDSATVFWTRYPDPFGPVPNAHIGCVGEIRSYYADVAGIVEIGVVSRRSDSLLYRFSEKSPRYRSFWICIAEDEIDGGELPDEYFISTREEPLDLVLIVDGEYKARLPVGIAVPVGKYCLLSWNRRFVRPPKLR